MIDLTFERTALSKKQLTQKLAANRLKHIDVLFADFLASVETDLLLNPTQCVFQQQWNVLNFSSHLRLIADSCLIQLTDNLRAFIKQRTVGDFEVNIRRNRGSKHYFYTVTLARLPTPTLPVVWTLERRSNKKGLQTIQGRLWAGVLVPNSPILVVDLDNETNVSEFNVHSLYRNKETIERFDLVNEHVYIRVVGERK